MMPVRSVGERRVSTSHTVRGFDAELNSLSGRLAAMGGVAEHNIARAVDALVRADLALARSVVADDEQLDLAKRDIDAATVALIARRQPMADDLRAVIGAMRIATDLERVGDLGRNIAKRVIVLSDARGPLGVTRGLLSLTRLVLSQLKDVLDAYATRSTDALALVRDRDAEIDAIYTSLFRELLADMAEDPRAITTGTHLLFCIKNLERIGDHATNIAETLHYMLTGASFAAERARSDETHKVSLD